MAAHALIDAYIAVNGVDLSDFCKAVRLPQGVESLDDTVMGDLTRSRIGGLKTYSLEVDFVQDFAASSVDQTISPLVGTLTTIEVRPTSAAVGTTNPKWTATVLVKDYQPVGGTVGELHMTRMVCESNTTLTRATS